jgi:hypothetical protein
MNNLIFQVQEWPFVLFFSRTKKNYWMEGDIQHTVISEDILRTIDPPDVKVHGSRIYYMFNGK